MKTTFDYSRFHIASLCLGFAALLYPTIAMNQSADSDSFSSVLKLSEAIATATVSNPQLQTSALTTRLSAESMEEAKTAHYSYFNVYANSSLLLTPLTFMIPRGTLGTDPATGSNPSQNVSVTTSQNRSSLIDGSASKRLPVSAKSISPCKRLVWVFSLQSNGMTEVGDAPMTRSELNHACRSVFACYGNEKKANHDFF